MKIKKILSVILSLILLNSCTGFSDAIQGKKRSENSDEFLVQKKNPLTAPPDMDELPVPSDQEKWRTAKEKIKYFSEKPGKGD